MKTRWKLVFLIAALFVALMLTWIMIPMSSEMRWRPHYYAWSRGYCSLSHDAYLAFKRDSEFQSELIGRPVDSIRHLFPDMNDGSDYRLGSYRSLYRPTVDRQRQPVDYYWLKGSENDFGFCVLVKNGVIIEFRYIKG